MHGRHADRALGAVYAVRRHHAGFLAKIARPYLAQVAMISTSMRGSASFASTVARAGRLAGSAHAVHAAFISSRLRISVTHTLAARILDITVAPAHNVTTIFFHTP